MWLGAAAPRPGLADGAEPALSPPALIDCPITAGLDRWIKASVQPAAIHYFGSRVVGITQIASYGCRGRNGNSFGNISEHAFGNALDIAAFQFANGQQIVVVNDWWRGTPRERAFLQAIFAGACNEFYTVLGPGSDRFHYNHIHVDFLQSNASHGRHLLPAVPGRSDRRGERTKSDSLCHAHSFCQAGAELDEKTGTVAGWQLRRRTRHSMIAESGESTGERDAEP